MKRILLILWLPFFIPTFAQYKSEGVGFQENKGQIVNQKGQLNNEVKYLLNSAGLNVQLRKNGFSYDVYQVQKTPFASLQVSKTLPHPKDEQTRPQYNLSYTFHRIDIDFINSNSKVEFTTGQSSEDFVNYYNIATKPEGVLAVHQYKEVTYRNIYPHIDVVFTVPNDPEKTVEYNFIVHPGAKISDIQLKFNGVATALDNNKIQMNVCFGKMQETLPLSWTEDGACKKRVTVKYRKIKNNVYGFETSDAVSARTLIIDPVPIRLWGTYQGGEGFDYAVSVFSKNGFIYLAGTTMSTTNIASNGAHQGNFASSPQSSYDSFFSKFNSDGTRVWATYYGGSKADDIFKITASDNNNIYIAGSSMSTSNIATPASHQPVNAGYSDGFLAKFNKDGIIQWGTYYGGLNNDEIRSIVVDANEKIYISGNTFSKENISTNGSHQPALGSLSPNNADGFIAKFDQNGNREWATYYGGSIGDAIYDSKLDSNGNIICIGSTYSGNNISTANSYKQSNVNSDRDGFLVKLDPQGNRIWGTYFGGAKMDYFHDLAIDSADNLYCFGQTQSTSGMSTPGVFQENYFINNTDNNGCVIKFNSQGFKIWGSYFYPEVLGSSVSKNGEVYFTGRVKAGFSSTPDSYQEFPVNNNPGTDSYLVKFNTTGERQWATYFGGEVADDALATAVDDNHNIYLTGSTQSLTNIATAGTYQPNHFNNTSNNSGDAFLVKFQDCESVVSLTSNSPICAGSTLELKASGGTNYIWTGPNGFISTDQNPIIINATQLHSGNYSCTITGSDICTSELKLNVIVAYNKAPVPDAAILPVIIGDCHTLINAIPTATDLCTGSITATTVNPLSYTLPGRYIIVWNYNNGNGNTATQNQTIIINSQPLPILTAPPSFCATENASLRSIALTGQNIKWYDALTLGVFLPDDTLLEEGKTYYASQSLNGCESGRIPVAVKVQNTPMPTANANQSFCSAANPTLENIAIVGKNIKWYDGSKATAPLSSLTVLENGKIYYASQTTTSCESARLAIRVSITNTPAIPTGNTNHVFCKNENATLSSMAINGINLKWYSSTTSTTPLSDTALVQNNTTYYVSQTAGCESERLAVVAVVNGAPLPIADMPQTFCIGENATVTDIAIKGENVKWYDSPQAGSFLNDSQLLEDQTYYATQTIANCESPRLAIRIKIQGTSPPAADENQNFCTQQNATLRTIKIAGENIKWYDSPTAPVSLSESTALENALTYYASQTSNNCESERIPIKTSILQATTPNCIDLVTEIPFVKFFTPNNDGYNDGWTIDPVYLAPHSSIRIFDRYGKLIKELTANTPWDGTYIGQDLPSSDYWFIATGLNGVEFKGHFSLKR